MTTTGCAHAKYGDGHCASMVCSNYVNKCPRHSTSGRAEVECSLQVMTNEAAERLRHMVVQDWGDRGWSLIDEALAAAWQEGMKAGVKESRRATVERIMDRIENAVAKPGAFPKRELMRMFARIRDEEAAR